MLYVETKKNSYEMAMTDSARLSVAFLVVLDLTVGSQGGGTAHAVQISPQLWRASGRERQSSPTLHYSRGCTLCAGGHTHTRLALRGGGDSLTDIPEEENVEGKDMGGWSRLREESIQDQSILEDSVRDFDDSQGSSVLDWTDGAADQGGTDPVTLPFVTPRERLTANQNNFSVWMKVSRCGEVCACDIPRLSPCLLAASFACYHLPCHGSHGSAFLLTTPSPTGLSE